MSNHRIEVDTRQFDTDATEEGAACVALAGDGGAGPEVAGVASRRTLEDAIEAALAHAGRTQRDVASWHVAERPGAAPSLGSARLAVDAARAVRSGVDVAVAAAAGPSVACAIVLIGEAG